MTHIVSDGLTLVQATGARVRDGIENAASGIRSEVGAVAGGLREEVETVRRRSEKSAARARMRSGWRARIVQLVASAAGAVAAWLVSRLVQTRLTRFTRLNGQGK